VETGQPFALEVALSGARQKQGSPLADIRSGDFEDPAHRTAKLSKMLLTQKDLTFLQKGGIVQGIIGDEIEDEIKTRPFSCNLILFPQ
jgi:hypothetical protein